MSENTESPAGAGRPEDQEFIETTVLPDSAAAELAAAAHGGSGIERELAEARAAAEENRNKYLRTAAEMDNLRKRTEREVENAHRYGIERFAAELLSVLDSLEMGLEAGAGASAETLLAGKQATLKQLHTVLDRFGVKAMDPTGQPFNPELHEALSMVPSATLPPNSVVTVVQRGFLLNGRLLRPARVLVASAPADGTGN